MIFDILGSGKGKNPFPGYQLKVGELCSLPALSTNDSSARALSIPTGCIPLCVKVEPEFRANSGNGTHTVVRIATSWATHMDEVEALIDLM